VPDEGTLPTNEGKVVERHDRSTDAKVDQKAKSSREKVQQEAAESHLYTQRAGGEVLSETTEWGGDRGNQHTGGKLSSWKLADIPMSEPMSHRWQKLSSGHRGRLKDIPMSQNP
jgi:hypothetical protein